MESDTESAISRLEAKLSPEQRAELEASWAEIAALLGSCKLRFPLPTIPAAPELRDPYGEMLRQGLHERIEAIIAAAGFPPEELAKCNNLWHEVKSQISLAELEELAKIAEGGAGPTIEDSAPQSAVDRFATPDQREAAIRRAVEKFGTVAEMATCFKVDYRDLRKWARHRSLAKGPSAKAERIERGLLPYCPE